MRIAFTILIPTLNEAANLARTLAAAQRAFGGAAEYIVVDGGSTDGTVALARGLGATVFSSARGRGVQMDIGSRIARGEALVLLHADTLLPPDASSAIAKALVNARVAGGAFAFAFDHDRPLSLLMRLLARAITLRSHLFRTATGDQAIFLRRCVLHKIGGLPQDPLFEDVRLVQLLRRHGRFVILPTSVHTSPRLWLSAGPLRVIAFHLALRTLHALGVSPQRLARWYAANADR